MPTGIIKRQGWTLHYTIGEVVAGPVSYGDKVETFRGKAMTVIDGTPPHKVSSSGRVYVKDDEDHSSEYYPSVIGARWVHEGGGLGGA